MDRREDLARRTKAAQALAGYTNAEQLAEATKELGNLGLKRIREIQQKRGEEARVFELRVIAEACSLPVAFFTIDFSRLADVEQFDIAERIEALERDVRQLAAERGAPAPPGELGRRAEGSLPSDESQAQSESLPEADRRQGGEG